MESYFVTFVKIVAYWVDCSNVWDPHGPIQYNEKQCCEKKNSQLTGVQETSYEGPGRYFSKPTNHKAYSGNLYQVDIYPTGYFYLPTKASLW